MQRLKRRARRRGTGHYSNSWNAAARGLGIFTKCYKVHEFHEESCTGQEPPELSVGSLSQKPQLNAPTANSGPSLKQKDQIESRYVSKEEHCEHSYGSPNTDLIVKSVSE